MKRNEKSKLKGISPFVVLLLLMTIFSSIFIGKIISASIMYGYDNPYHFEKVVAVIVRIEKVESASNWNDYYILYAAYEDEETGIQYETHVPGRIYDRDEAETYIGKKTYILIDREYGISIPYGENAIKSDIPIDIIVYSVLLAFCLAVLILSIIKITKKNKKHYIWIAIFILLMLSLAGYVAYASLDMNYLKQIKSLSVNQESIFYPSTNK